MDDMAKTKKQTEEVKEEVKETVETPVVEETSEVDTRPQEEKTAEEQSYGHTPENAPAQVVVKETVQRNIQ